MRLGIVAYLVPFVFAFHPARLLRGTLAEVVLAVAAAAAGVILLGIGCAGTSSGGSTGASGLSPSWRAA
jgi:TRAP-type uncharacterized transport system fused permease subunit